MSPKNLSKEQTNKLNLCILSKDKRGQKGDKKGNFLFRETASETAKTLEIAGFFRRTIILYRSKKAENGTYTFC